MSFSGEKRETKDAWAESGLRKRKKSVLPPPIITKVWFSSRNYETGYFTSLNFSNRGILPPSSGFEGGFATVTVVLSFSFLTKFQLNL